MPHMTDRQPGRYTFPDPPGSSKLFESTCLTDSLTHSIDRSWKGPNTGTGTVGRALQVGPGTYYTFITTFFLVQCYLCFCLRQCP